MTYTYTYTDIVIAYRYRIKQSGNGLVSHVNSSLTTLCRTGYKPALVSARWKMVSEYSLQHVMQSKQFTSDENLLYFRKMFCLEDKS